MKTKRVLSWIALLLVFCTLLTACKKPDQIGDPDTPSDPAGTPPPAACTHAQTTLQNYKQSTCTEKGYSGDVVCDLCGVTLTVGQETDYGHILDKGFQTKDPTCIELGVKTYTCTECGATVTESVPTVGHDDRYHDALDGTHNHTCNTCVTVNGYDAHVPADPAGRSYPPSCTLPAYTEYYCTLCHSNYRVYSEENKELGHDWGEWTTVDDATCQETGKNIRQCHCGAKETVTLPTSAEAHVMKETSRVAATCTATGTIYYECAYENCNHTASATIPMIPHTLTEETSGDGWTHSYCTANGCTYKVSSFDASDVTTATVNASTLDSEKAFEVNTQKAKIEFPKDVVSEMTKNAGADVSIQADVVGDSKKDELLTNASNLTEDDKARLQDVDIYDFGVTVGSGTLSNFGESLVTVTIPYTLKQLPNGETEDPAGILVWYVKDDGTLESVPATYKDGTVTFQVSHFSYYAVAYVVTQEMKCLQGDHDRKLVNTVPATCEQYGYTVYECKCCHTIELDNYVEKQNHDWGELTMPTITCEDGGYAHQSCSKCEAVKNFTYYRAKGHTVTTLATCTTASICADCGHIAVPAKGHKWSEWSLIVEPTDVRAGLRRRHCTTCGEFEKVSIAPTGDIEQFGFVEYHDLFDAILSKLLNFKNGTVTLNYDLDNEMTCTMDLTARQQGESYLMLIDLNFSEYYNGTWHPFHAKYLYQNGLITILESDTVLHTELESMMSPQFPLEVLHIYIEEIFNVVAPRAEGAFDELEELFVLLDAFAAEELNKTFADLGLTWTMPELAKTFKDLKNVYAYTALKLGLHTGTTVDGDLMGAAEVLELMSHYMTVTDGENGQKVYTVDFQEYLDAMNLVLDWIDENGDKALSEALFDLIDEDILSLFPDLTTFAKLETELRASFPGTMKVSAALDQVISILEREEVYTVEGFYTLIESLYFELSGIKVDIDGYVKLNYNKNLDGMAQDLFRLNSMEELYDALFGLLKNTQLKNASMPNSEATLSDVVAMLRDFWDKTEMTYTFTFTVDANNVLVSLDMVENVTSTFDGSMKLESSIAIKQDDTVTVEIPQEMAPVVEDTITKEYDAQGNLLITVPEGYDYTLSMGGYGNLAIEHTVEPDPAMSKMMGFDVYVLKRPLWNNSTRIGNYLLINGKYYSYRTVYGEEYYDIVNTVELDDVIADWKAVLPDENTEPAGMLSNSDTSVYETPFGPIYQEGDVWYLMLDYHDSNGYNEATQQITTYYWNYKAVLLSEALETVRLSNTSRYNSNEYSYKLNGKEVPVIALYMTLGQKVFGDETQKVMAYIDADSNMRLIAAKRVYSESSYHLVAEVPVLPAHDIKDQYKRTFANLFDMNGAPITATVEEVELANLLPTYYAKLVDGYYVPMGDKGSAIPAGFISALDTRNLPALTLPNGLTMYVIKAEGDWAYGYTKFSQTLYVQTACRKEGDTVVDVRYRSGQNTKWARFDGLLDPNAFLTKNGTLWTVNAEFFRQMKDICSLDGSYFYLTLNGKKTVGTVTYQIANVVSTYVLPESFSYGPSNSERELDWYSWQISGSNAAFAITPNADGSFTVSYGASQRLEVSYEVDKSFPLDTFARPEPEKSQETGLKIYSAVTGSYRNSYVQKDGKLYNYRTYNTIHPNYAESLQDLIANHWQIERMSYWTTTSVEGESVPIYQASIHFGGCIHGTYSFDLYLGLYKNQLCVLTGVVNNKENERSIIFEGLEPIRSFFSQVARTAEIVEARQDQTVYRDGKLEPYYSIQIKLTDLVESSAETINGYYCHVYATAKNQTYSYVYRANEDGTYLELGEEATLPSDATLTDSYYNSYYNGRFQLQSYSTFRREYFVKLAGRYYRLDSYQNNNWSKSPEELVQYTEILPQTDGTVFYGIPNRSDGYLKTQNGRYVSARKVITETGYEIHLNNLYEYYYSAYQFKELGLLDDYVIITGNSVTVKKELMDMLPAFYEEGFEIHIYSQYNSSYALVLDYYDLVGWIKLTNNGGNGGIAVWNSSKNTYEFLDPAHQFEQNA